MPGGDGHLATRPSRANLSRVWLIRSILLAGLLTGFFLLRRVDGVSLPWFALGAVLGLAILFNLAVWFRLRRPWPLGEPEFFGHLLFDVLFLTALLYLSGGSTNPLVSYYLIPLIISAAVLRPAFTWAIALLTLSAYTSLLFWFVPFEWLADTASGHSGHAEQAFLSAHFVGMWVNFAFSALLIAWFVVRMAQSLRRQEEQIAETREQALRNEQIIGVAGMAAGTAHELRTPLATMTLLVEEMQQEPGGLQDELELMQDQLERCDRIIRELVDSAEQGASIQVDSLERLLSVIQDKWSIARPESPLRISISPEAGGARLHYDVSLHHALLNFLHNAADASPHDVSLEARLEQGKALILIEDRGPGIPGEIAGNLGKRLVSARQGGLGLGVLVSSASIERLSGEVMMMDRQGGGTRLEIRLPLASGKDSGHE